VEDVSISMKLHHAMCVKVAVETRMEKPSEIPYPKPRVACLFRLSTEVRETELLGLSRGGCPRDQSFLDTERDYHV
jgi:hypothetical protein